MSHHDPVPLREQVHENAKLIDAEIDAPKSLSNTRLSGLMLWDITFWGYTPKEIKESKNKISQDSLQGRSFLLQEYKDRSKRLE